MVTKGVLLAGVGGQGILLASKIIAAVLVDRGFDVKVSEVHGMAQRGGDVHCMLRYGEEVASPLIGIGEADILLAFEEVEALRWIKYLRITGIVFINQQRILMSSVSRQEIEYPDALTAIEKVFDGPVVINGPDLARQAGSPKAVNVVLLGAASWAFGLPEDVWVSELKRSIPEKFIEMNLVAFALGREAGKGACK